MNRLARTKLQLARKQAPFAVALMLYLLLALISRACLAESPRMVIRKGPLRLKKHETLGTAKIPDDVPFGLMCDIEGVIQSGDWKVNGIVTGHEPGLITFETEEFRVGEAVRSPARPGRLAYRLPQELPLPLSEGDPITLMHDQDADEKRIEWDIHLSSGPELIFATAHRHDDTPPQSAENAEVLFDGAPGGHVIFFWADPNDNDTVQDLNSVAQMHAPVSMRVRDENQMKQIDVAHGEITPVKLDGKNYVFVVLSSEYLEHHSHGNHSDHDAEQAGTEATSHSIECILLKTP